MYPNFKNKSRKHISITWLSQYQEPQTKLKDTLDSHEYQTKVQLQDERMNFPMFLHLYIH